MTCDHYFNLWFDFCNKRKHILILNEFVIIIQLDHFPCKVSLFAITLPSWKTKGAIL